MDLVNSCIIGNTEEAMKLIMNNNINFSIVDYNMRRTALIWTCRNAMEVVALELIKTGKSNPYHIANDGKTALIWACRNAMEVVALELIKTGQSNPYHIANDGYTALIFACQYKITKVILELIKTGKSNPDHIDNDDNTALSWACENDMKEVAYELVSIGVFTINDLLFLKPEWVPEEFLIMHPVDVTEVNI